MPVEKNEILMFIDGDDLCLRIAKGQGNPDWFQPGASIIENFIHFINYIPQQDWGPYYAFAFSRGPENFRHDIYPNYHSRYQSLPPKIFKQYGALAKIVKAMGYYTVSEDWYESEDIISSLIHRFTSPDRIIRVATTNQLLFQLLGPNIQLIDLISEKISTFADVQSAFPFPLSLINEWFMLAGDAKRGVSAPYDIPEKDCHDLLNLGHGLFAIFDDPRLVEPIPKSIRRYWNILHTNRDTLRVRCKLFTLDDTVPLTTRLSEFNRTKKNKRVLSDMADVCQIPIEYLLPGWSPEPEIDTALQ